ASAFVGLWEIPHKFVWETSDGSTFKLGEILEIDATRKAGSSRFVKEVIRFYFTYPVYTISLFWHEFMQFIFHQSFSGYYFVIFQIFVRYCIMTYSLPLILLTIALLSLVYRYRAKQTLLLGWSVFFNLPFFFLIYSSGGRFYPPHSVAMLAFSAPLLFDVNFYKHIVKRPRPLIVIAVLSLCIYFFGESLDNALINWDAFRYWTPFLDPADSVINILK
ncbi:hypothetical protein ACFL30_03470, partial [Candidatus Latescibacterota bacterium]